MRRTYRLTLILCVCAAFLLGCGASTTSNPGGDAANPGDDSGADAAAPGGADRVVARDGKPGVAPSGSISIPSGTSNRLFHTATTLPNGHIFVAGGYTDVVQLVGRWEVSHASDVGLVFDPATGQVQQSANLMNKGRGAHAAVYLPKSKLVLLVGGAERLYKEKDDTCFPWYWEKDKAGDVGFTYELFDPVASKFLDWDSEEWPDEGHEFVMHARRVFPVAALNNDGTVLVTGGGYWPSCGTGTEKDADYRIAELYRPKSENYTGCFMNSYGALTIGGMRSGHTGVLLEAKDNLATHLFWGGTADGPYAELYQESSGQMDGNFGLFKEVDWLDSSAYKKRPYFHTMTALKQGMFLLVGGVRYSSGKLKVPSAGDAFKIKVMGDQKIGVSPVDGLGQGRYFHSAATYDGDHAVVYGGFSSQIENEENVFAGAASSDVRFFDLAADQLTVPILDATLPARAGHTASALSHDCQLIVGGAEELHTGLEYEVTSVELMADLLCF